MPGGQVFSKYSATGREDIERREGRGGHSEDLKRFEMEGCAASGEAGNLGSVFQAI